MNLKKIEENTLISRNSLQKTMTYATTACATVLGETYLIKTTTIALRASFLSTSVLDWKSLSLIHQTHV